MHTGVHNFSSAMRLVVFIACMLLQVTAIPGLPEPKILVVFPSQVESLESAEVCMHVFDGIRAFKMSLKLEINKINQTIFADQLMPSYSPQLCTNFYKCFPFKAPPVRVTEEYMRGIVGKLYVTATDMQHKVIFDEGKQLLILKKITETLAQTDKPVYKQGETVRCRILSMNSKFITANDVYPLIYLQDPQGNRIGQWLNVKPTQGIAEISIPLISEAMIGDYSFAIKKLDGTTIYKSFTVQRYVPVKFETIVNAPEKISIMDPEFKFTVCGEYTYQQPVKGAVELTVCRNMYYWTFYGRFSNQGSSGSNICQYFSGKTENNGCFLVVAKTEPFMNVTGWGYEMQLVITARLEEDGTGIKRNGTGTIQLSQTIATVQFQNVSSYYRKDFPFTGQILMLDAHDKAIPNRPVYLTSQYSNVQINKTFTTDARGIVSFSLTTSNWSGYISLRASYLPGEATYSAEYNDAYLYIEEFYANTRSYVSIKPQYQEFKCGVSAVTWIEYLFYLDEMPNAACQNIYYKIITRGNFVRSGQYSVSLPKKPAKYIKGSFAITFETSSDTSPIARVFVYAVVSNAGVMADSFDFKVSKCFKNKVSLQFSKSRVLPGSQLSIKIKAAPGSLCALRAIDKSVLLLKPETELTADLVYDSLPIQDQYGYPYEVSEYEFNPCNNYGKYMFYYQSSMDTSKVFQNAGIKYITNCNIKKPVNCSISNQPEPSMVGDGKPRPLLVMKTQAAPSGGSGSGNQPRKNFNETWIWQLETVPNGEKSISVTALDTITEWDGSMFCTAPIGFGLSNAASVVTFKTLFAEPALPYSMVRGETINLLTKVFYYEKRCAMVQVTLANSPDYDAVPCKDCQYTGCMCANEDKTVSWKITPKNLGMTNFTITAKAIKSTQLCNGSIPVVPSEGSSDTVIKSLMVEPEGIPVALSQSSLMCVNGTSVTEVVVMQPPVDAIKGSVIVMVNVFGDIMGSALQNLGDLLAMPYGCGEQNMLGFSVDTSVLNYAQSTKQLTNDIKEKAISFLQAGYQRELNYKRNDGSFSAFGNSDASGSLWLTLYVISQFVQAAKWIFIDNAVIDAALQWISQNQMPDGCFQNVGVLYHTAMKGGVNDNISLSAYACYALQQFPVQTPTTELLINNTLTCLRNNWLNVTNPYTMAVMANVFRNPEDASRREALLNKLDQLAIKKDGLIHWGESENGVPGNKFYWNTAPSAQVEMAGYVVLACLTKKILNSADLGYVSGIIRWIEMQQKQNGGFENTQDTVVGFAAIAKYGEYVGAGVVQATVNIYKEKVKLKTLQVNQENRFLLQQWSVRNGAGNYTIEVSGKGCVLLQRILQYNILPAKNPTTFFFEVSTNKVQCEPQPVFSINITARYVGDRNITNMIIITVNMLTGVSPDLDSLEAVKQQSFVKNVEYSAPAVIIYLDGLPQGQTEYYGFTVNQDIPVSNQKPSSATIQDYYMPEEKAETSYSGPCQQAVP